MLNLSFRKGHIGLFANYLQQMDTISNYDLYSRLQGALGGSIDDPKEVVQVDLKAEEWNRFNELMHADQNGQLYELFDELVSGGEGYTGVLAQFIQYTANGSEEEKAEATLALTRGNELTNQFKAVLNERVLKASEWLNQY